ncbi:hypothetical protein ACLOJK_041331 [Asimina triloba]
MGDPGDIGGKPSRAGGCPSFSPLKSQNPTNTASQPYNSNSLSFPPLHLPPLQKYLLIAASQSQEEGAILSRSLLLFLRLPSPPLPFPFLPSLCHFLDFTRRRRVELREGDQEGREPGLLIHCHSFINR